METGLSKHLLLCPESLGMKPVDEEIYLVPWQDTPQKLTAKVKAVKDFKTFLQSSSVIDAQAEDHST